MQIFHSAGQLFEKWKIISENPIRLFVYLFLTSPSLSSSFFPVVASEKFQVGARVSRPP